MPGVCSLALDRRERNRRGFRMRLQLRIVLDDVDGALIRYRHLDPGIQHIRGIERTLDRGKQAQLVWTPHTIEQWRAQPAIAVLAGECPSKLRHEFGDSQENSLDAFPPVRSPRVDQRIDVNMSVPRMTEDDPARVVSRQNASHSADVCGQ